jgi:hypothetical protein
MGKRGIDWKNEKKRRGWSLKFHFKMGKGAAGGGGNTTPQYL